MLGRNGTGGRTEWFQGRARVLYGRAGGRRRLWCGGDGVDCFGVLRLLLERSLEGDSAMPLKRRELMEINDFELTTY